uniref:Pith domain-containing protein n=1 Tax=Tetraselmis sp. GSL018 TaxID=582737 RepID=A0A061S3X8_9CHLO|mmetsp:Transcript_12355/g.29346  ORF Transcript_12355/g.29346 Transcript_12355/m.29346 type:complete len:170 (+) Transcript_12355:211-720(+)|eukprot:CAMPEP_0177606436 /NCGR_PEP_ID=MMETSP0419_2-20121207/17308_1 /TAXON_ID=582737 /ORGANISM="Tetraselmis sp., Strain GSL018" /LENGTH=169 /DNA_ID=CAMNT_0019100801 /DNA_START=154 /DNA_END=663 /DNA_ORIENTATION=-
MSNLTDLLDYIDWSSVECLNQQPGKELSNALKQGYRENDELYLESDTDEQLLIYIPFNQNVKLSKIMIKGSEGPYAPRKVKLFVNRRSMGFEQAAEEPATQELLLDEEHLAGNSIPLKFVKFQSVQSLTIFVEDNQGDEETTKVMKLKLMGLSGEKMDVSDIKKIDENQ